MDAILLDGSAVLLEGKLEPVQRACFVRESGAPARPNLLERVRAALRVRHYSGRTEEAYVAWIRRFVLASGKRHPAEMGVVEVTRFLSSLATDARVSASTQNQALAAILFLYREVLGRDLPWLDDAVRAKKPRRLPIVLTRDEVASVLRQLEGVPRLMATLLYGSGLRLLECVRLRVKDLDFASSQILVRAGKGRCVSTTLRHPFREFSDLNEAVWAVLLDSVFRLGILAPSRRPRRLDRTSFAPPSWAVDHAPWAEPAGRGADARLRRD